MPGPKPRLGKPVGPPPVSRLLTEQGDARLIRDPRTGLNRYGCQSFPGRVRPCYGSATATSISQAGFASIHALHARVAMAAPSVQAAEFDRIRLELAGLCGVDNLAGTEVVFAASGTDLHLLAVQLHGRESGGADSPPLAVVLAETPETGNGVPAALAGRHYNTRAPFQAHVEDGGAMEGLRAVEARTVAGRRPDGGVRPLAEVDAEAARLVEEAVGRGQDVLLVLSDQSKTGLLTPSPARVLELKRRFGTQVEVLVDACQLRLGPETLRAYVEHGFVVAVTGSKFATGPAFSGALLVPARLAGAWKRRALPESLGLYSARADWPKGWAGRESLAHPVNLGLLFRWQAALTEMHAFHRLSRPAVEGFFRAFGEAVRSRLSKDPAFEPLEGGSLDRGGVAPGGGWDSLPTLFPFLLRSGGRVLGYDAARAVYLEVLERHGEIGQPAHCGHREGTPLGALRMCASMRLAVDALGNGGRGRDAVLAEALEFLGKISATVGAGRTPAPR